MNLDAIGNASLFRGLTDDHRAELAQLCTRTEIAPRTHLFKLGDCATTLWVVQRGIIELTMPLALGDSEEELVVEELVQGDCLGWSALIEPHTLTMSARAKSPVKLVGFSRERLLPLFEERPTLGYRVLSNLAVVVGRRLHISQAMWAREFRHHVRARFRA